MKFGKKSLVLLLGIVLIIIAIELTVQFFSDFEVLRTYIAAELSSRLEAKVEIQRVSLDALPLPDLQMHDVKVDFADGSRLRVPQIELSLSLRGLLSANPEIASIELKKPDVRIVMQSREAESDTPDRDKRQKKQGEYIESLLQAIPSGIKVHDGTLHIKAPSGSTLVLEDVEAEAGATFKGLRLSVECTSSMWKQLKVVLAYRDPAVDLSLDARDIDIVKTSMMLTAFVGEDLPAVDVLQDLDGIFSSAALTISAPDVARPTENLTISGRGSFEDMGVTVADMGLEVRELTGNFELDNANITFTDVGARLKNSRIRNVVVHLDEARGFAPELITADIRLDLSDVPGLLHLIPDPDVREEIALIKNPTGTARATVEVRAEADSYSTEVTLGKLVLQSSYRDFPQNFELSRGTCTYRNEVLSFDGLTGKLGSSTLPDFSLSFGLDDDEQFSASARDAKIVLDDLRMALASFDDSRELIENFPTSPDGRMQIETIRLAGPLAKPETWDIAVEARLDDVSIAAAGLEGPVEVRSGVLKADSNTCTLSEFRSTYLDAELAGSLILEGYLDGVKAVTAEARGLLGAKSLDGIQGLVDMPSVLKLRPRLKVEGSRLEWNRDGDVSVAGNFVLGGKTKVGLKLRADSSIFEITELKIRDAASQCRLGLKIEEDIFSCFYKGMLKKETLDRVLQNNSFLQGWLEGDISVRFNQKNPRRSSAAGKLAWEKAGFPGLTDMPITLTSAEMTARERLLTVGSAGLTAGLGSAGVQGSIGFTDEGFVLDLALHAESIDVDAIADRLSDDDASSGGSAEEFWETPLRGTVTFKAQELKKDSFVCKPFEALVSFADRSVTVNTEGTRMCSVALPATVKITPDDITLDVRPTAEKSPMQEFIQCIYGGEDLITGTLDIDGAVRAQAAPDALLESLAGEFTISARKGRIYRSGLIAKIISFLSIRNILKLSISDMVQRGYDYQSLDIDGAVTGQTLGIDRCVLISTSFTLVCRGTIDLGKEAVDLDALVTPFQVHNQLLAKVPLVGGRLSQPMMGVPLKISGQLGDPRISTRTTSAVTDSLSNITRSVLNLPVRIIRPVLPGRSSKEQ